MICKTRKNLLIATLLGMAIICNAQTNNAMEKEKFTTEQNDVLNAILDMTAAFHKKDMKGVMASYEPGAVIVFEPEKPVSDPQAIRNGFTAFFNVDPRFEYSGHEVFINGDLAIHFAPWTMSGRAPDETEITQSGLSVVVLRKQPDGRWLMVFDNPHGQYLLDK